MFNTIISVEVQQVKIFPSTVLPCPLKAILLACAVLQGTGRLPGKIVGTSKTATKLNGTSHLLQPVATDPCRNGGQCAVKESAVRCLCPPGWAGSQCQQKANRDGDNCTDQPGEHGCPVSREGSGAGVCFLCGAANGSGKPARPAVLQTSRGKWSQHLRTRCTATAVS